MPVKMSEEIETLFKCIDEEVVQLFYRWKILHQLFGSGKENLDLLNRSGSNVFALLQALIIENLFLTLSRLTDPEEMGKYKNLSIRYFLQKIVPLVGDEARENLRMKLDGLVAVTDKLRTHRNKRIAHLDLEHAIELKSLPSVEYDDFKTAIEHVRAIMKDILFVLFDSTGYHEPSIAYGCDGDYLLRVLRKAYDLRNDTMGSSIDKLALEKEGIWKK